jgi:hypothetical protein
MVSRSSSMIGNGRCNFKNARVQGNSTNFSLSQNGYGQDIYIYIYKKEPSNASVVWGNYTSATLTKFFPNLRFGSFDCEF